MRPKHYSPVINRFLVCALYHAAKSQQVPMTKFVNGVLEQALKGSEAWSQAEQSMRMREKPAEYGQK